MKIPKQLQPFRFIKTFRKNPIEAGWPVELTRFKRNADGSYTDNITSMIYKSKGKIYKGELTSYNYDEMDNILQIQEETNNHTITYGVLGGFNGLVIVDLDEPKLAEKLKNIWPFSDTFTVLSGKKKLPHFYFKCQDYSNVLRFDSSTTNKRIIDVQGVSSFVVGPNSKVLSNGVTQVYRVENDVDIVDIDYQELINIIDENIGEAHKIQKKEKNIYTGKYFMMDPIAQQIFKKISCDKILDEYGVDISSNPGDTPFAESENKKCLHRTEYLWFDHHTQMGGNVIQLYSKLYNIDSIQAKYDLAERAGVTEEIFKQALDYFIKNKQHEMTELLSMKFMGSTPTHTLRIDKQRGEEIYIYKEGIYIPNGVSYIKEFCNNILGKWYTETIVKKIVDKIAIRTKIDPDEFFKEEDPYFIPVQNGILNIETKKLYEFTPEKRFFNKLPVTFSPTKTCDVTIKHFGKVLNGEQDVMVMQELYGYLLFRNYKFEKAFMFYGIGRNGKSKTIDQMKELIGGYNSINLSLQQLQNEKFLRANLHKKLANLADDIGNAKLEETQIFKELTGGSTITADRKHLSTITFKNYAKMIFSANQLPESVDDTYAYWSRWKMIGFTKKFLPSLEYQKQQKENTLEPYHRIADEDMLAKLTTKEELSGVLNWALDGFSRLIKNKGFSRPDSHDEVRKIWRRNISNAMPFIQDKIKITYHPDDYEEHENLYQTYVRYCASKSLVAESDRIFRKLLREESLVCIRKRVAIGNEWRWQGVKLEE